MWHIASIKRTLYLNIPQRQQTVAGGGGAFINSPDGESAVRCDRAGAIICWMSEQHEHMIPRTDGACGVEGGEMSERWGKCTREGPRKEHRDRRASGRRTVHFRKTKHFNQQQQQQACFLRMMSTRTMRACFVF